MSGNWLNRFRELAKDVSPDEYLFAEDREAFDQRRIWRRLSATLAICGLLLVAILTSAYAAGWRVIRPQRVAILETAETVVPDAAHWATERGPRRAKMDARVLRLLEQLQDAPQPDNTHAWISRYTDRVAPLIIAERSNALVALASYVALYDEAYWPAVVDSIVTVGALAGQPRLLDFFRDFGELTPAERARVVDLVEKNRGLKNALHQVRNEIDRMNTDINAMVHAAQRNFESTKTLWATTQSRQRQCSTLFVQAQTCLGAIFAR